MKKTGLRRKLVAGLAALAILGTAAELPMMEQTAYAQSPELPTETNTTFAKAKDIEFGGSLAATFTRSDTVRYYKFSLAETCRLDLRFDITERDRYRDMILKIYDATQTEICNVKHGFDPWTTYFYLTGGDYYLSLEYYNGGSLSFIADADSMGESFMETQDVNNDLWANASSIALKSRYKGVLADNENLDYYKFQVPSAGKITFNMTNSVSDTVQYIFYDQLQTPVYTSQIGKDNKITQPVEINKGIYYLAVAKENVNRGSGSYMFSIDFVAKGGGSVTKPMAVTVKQVPLKSVRNPARKKMTVKWSRVSGASGYELWYSTSPNFKKGVVKKKISSSVTSKTYSGLKKKKTYYVKIRAYKNVNGVKKYGKWSRRGAVSIRK